MIKRYVTLMEMMIVMFLIAMIIGVVAYNYRGALDEGKAFKSRAGIEKLESILNLAIADDSEKADNVETEWKEYVKSSPLVRNANDLIRDGWGAEYEVKVEDGRIKVTSSNLEAYKSKK